MYKHELAALKAKNRFRKRKITEGFDFCSNDYLGLSTNEQLFDAACALLKKQGVFAPTASQLLNGYHPIHKRFENFLTSKHGFEDALLVSSGYMANLAAIGTLARQGDTIYMDEQYHASGREALKLSKAETIFFAHNDPADLAAKLQENNTEGRKIIAVEGVYSMSGAVIDPVIFDVAEKHDAIVIVDEAHSIGTLGSRLLGVFDEYAIKPTSKHIKIGTLGKALGSFGAYILAGSEVISFLENRAKPIIYSTAPSLFDTAQSLVNYKFVAKHSKRLKQRLQKRLQIAEEYLGVRLRLPILTVHSATMSIEQLHEKLTQRGFTTGLIRPPTVQKPMLRITLGLQCSKNRERELFEILVQEGAVC